METYLNSEATLETRIKIKLNFSADLDELYYQPKLGYRSKTFTIDPSTIYDFTYVDRSPHHKTELIKTIGKVIAVSYNYDRSKFVHSAIYESVAKNIGRIQETDLEPIAIRIDASTIYNRDVRDVDIADIRDIDIHDNGIDLFTYQTGDIVRIELMNSRIYETAIIRDILTCDPEGDVFVIDEMIPDSEKSDLTGEPIETAEFRKTIVKKVDILTIELKRAVPKFDYKNGDTIEIWVGDPGIGQHDAYPGIIMDIITHKMADDEANKYTTDNVVGILLKYREGTAFHKTKEITRFFYMEEICRILPFTFPWSDPDVVTVADEGHSRGDDPDDIEDYMYPTSYEIGPDDVDDEITDNNTPSDPQQDPSTDNSDNTDPVDNLDDGENIDGI